GTLYSLTSNLALRWQRIIGAAVQSVPAFSADALYIVSDGRLRAYHPASGAPLWDRALGAAIIGSGSAAVGYGRDIYVQSSGGKIVAIGEGWIEAPLAVLATPVTIAPLQSLHGMRVEWNISLPSSSILARAFKPQAATPAGFLVQRSSDGSSWTDVATLPGTTAVYTDTSVTAGQSYLYRVQALDATGNDSDFTTATESARSLPALPQAPTISGVTAMAADQLRVTWSQAASSEVTSYRLERGAGASGPFQAIARTTGETREYTDSALAPGTTYFYRIVAINGLGASSPSNVASGATRQRSLPAPRSVVASLLPDGRVRVSWSPGPAGVTAVVEVNPQGFAGYLPLGTAGAAGPFTYSPGMPSSFGYRVKFVQGNNESQYGVASLRVRTSGFVGQQRFGMWLPLTMR
ncbi:MAG TPA: fibronectin type III domain-containing protein, partial [Roseiflexaceae bacterium]|nr:fibronectin type III domain-containing protein [Roseiflexaceae bacterium]